MAAENVELTDKLEAAVVADKMDMITAALTAVWLVDVLVASMVLQWAALMAVKMADGLIFDYDQSSVLGI